MPNSRRYKKQDQPVQIVKYNKGNKKYELNQTALEKIFCNKDVANANIAVISIAGAFRKGKSFMLSFFLRYMNETYIRNRANWLGSNSLRLSGFAWRGGSERHTTGIWMWSKVFIKVLPSGEKIGVVLMDTQGTFDSNSTTQDNVMIFSLSTMLSSIQIYNLFNNIQENDLQYLQLFTEYGKMVLQASHDAPFQKMLFLIRDWSYSYEAPYGFQGGQQLLERALKVDKDQDKELTCVRDHLKSCFEKLDCFLMPNPGDVATNSETFTGQLKDIKTEFKDMLRELVPALLAPENILVKKINGTKVKGKTFLTLMRAYWKIFSSDHLPKAQTILGATSEANNLSAKEEATEFYQYKMNEAVVGIGKPILQFREMIELNNNITRISLELFRSKAIMGDEQMKTCHYNKLKDSFQNYFVFYMGQNDMKNTKNLEATINNLNAEINNFKSSNTNQMLIIEKLKTQIIDVDRSSRINERQLKKKMTQLEQKKAAEINRFHVMIAEHEKSSQKELKRLDQLLKIQHSNEIYKEHIKTSTAKQKWLENEMEQMKYKYEKQINRISHDLEEEKKPTLVKLYNSIKRLMFG